MPNDDSIRETMLAAEKRLFDELTTLGSDPATVAAVSAVMSISTLNLTFFLTLLADMTSKDAATLFREVAGLVIIELDKETARIAEDHGPTFADSSRAVMETYVTAMNAIAKHIGESP